MDLTTTATAACSYLEATRQKHEASRKRRQTPRTRERKITPCSKHAWIAGLAPEQVDLPSSLTVITHRAGPSNCRISGAGSNRHRRSATSEPNGRQLVEVQDARRGGRTGDVGQQAHPAGDLQTSGAVGDGLQPGARLGRALQPDPVPKRGRPRTAGLAADQELAARRVGD